MTSTPSPAPRSFVRPFSNTTMEGHTMPTTNSQPSQPATAKKEGKNMKKFALPALLLTAAISLASCSGGGTPTDACATAGSCTVTIAAVGAPSGATFSVTGPGTTQSGAAGVKAIDKEGAWTVTPAAVSGYTVSPSSAAVNISSSNKTPSVSFTYTSTTPLPPAATVSPADASLGNPDTTEILVTFNQPMNISLPLSNVFSPGPGGSAWPAGWSAAWTSATTLKIKTATGAPFLYATAPMNTTAAQIPNEYKYTINAVTASGQFLNQSYSFKTAVKHPGVVIATVPAKNKTVDFTTQAVYACVGTDLCIGDTNADHQVAAYLTFDLSALDSLSADQQPSSFLAAPLTVTQTALSAGAFGNLTDSGEALQLYGLSYGDPGAVSFSWAGFLNLPAANKITGNFGPSLGPYSSDVKTHLQADWVNRAAQNKLSQYQVRFAKPFLSNFANDQLRISNAPSLSVDYLSNK